VALIADGRGDLTPGGLVRMSCRKPFATMLASLCLLLALPAIADAVPRKIGIWGINKDDITKISDAQIAALANRGIGMAIIQTRQLYSAKGRTGRFTGNLSDSALATSAEYAIQRSIRSSRLIERLAAKGIQTYFGFHAVNAAIPEPTAIQPWFDEKAWTTKAIPNLTNLAAACKAMGCKGIAFDGEEYGRSRSLWEYPSGSATATVDATVRRRGQQVMQALADGYGGQLHAIVYYARFPGSFEEASRRCCTSEPVDYRRELHKDFWLGATQATGWDRIDFWDAYFYKGSGCSLACVRSGLLPAGSDPRDSNVTVREAVRRNAAFFRSRGLSEATLAKIGFSNFIWIPAGPSPSSSDDAQPPATVRNQLLAARDQGTTEFIPVYVNGGGPTQSFNWAPYEPAMREVAGLRP
jgi:hypothetical protein